MIGRIGRGMRRIPPPKLKSNDLCSEYGVEYILFNSQGKTSEIIEEGE